VQMHKNVYLRQTLGVLPQKAWLWHRLRVSKPQTDLILLDNARVTTNPPPDVYMVPLPLTVSPKKYC